MCELLGLSSKHQTTINLSLSVLAQRGENPNMHGDGWGIAFHEGQDVRLIKDAGAAKNSEWVEFIKQQDIHSHDIIAHIRKSTVGSVHYSNTHPFIRELMGRVHSFAHNGTLKNILHDPRFKPQQFHPIGETDSELAFCVLMDRMQVLWHSYHDDVPSVEERLTVIKDFADEMRSLGPANFLYSDGDTFFAHGDERLDPKTDTLSWPGLHYVQLKANRDQQHISKSFKKVISIESDDDVITLFASVPLNNHNDWKPLRRGEVIAVSRGQIVSSLK